MVDCAEVSTTAADAYREGHSRGSPRQGESLAVAAHSLVLGQAVPRQLLCPVRIDSLIVLPMRTCCLIVVLPKYEDAMKWLKVLAKTQGKSLLRP